MEQQQQKKLQLVKATLTTGKTVLLHEMRVSHTEKAAKKVAQEAGENQALFQMLMQKALVQELLFKINDKVVTMSQRDDIDSLFTLPEYSQVLKVINKISGGDDSKGEAKVELVSE